MPVEVELFDDLEAVARDAGGALDRAARACLFDRLDWYRLTMAHAPPPGAPLILRARDGDASAWLFLTAEDGRAHAFASWYTLHYGAVLDGDAERLLPAIARTLRTRRPSIATVDLHPLDADDRLTTAFRQAGWFVSRTQSSANWIARTEGMDFETYWAARPSRLRNTARRKAQAAGLDIVIRPGFDADAWAHYEAVYRKSWKPAEGSPAFLRALAEQEGAAGTLRLGIATRGGTPIAAQYWLVENGIATIHKLAYIESARGLSPGTVLSLTMFRHVIDRDKPALIDFGTGDDPYKADWMDERRPLYRMLAHNPLSFRGLAGAAREAAAKLVRRASSD
jgi:hypothetical protein